MSNFNRRVYAREFRSVLGYGATWFAKLEREGLIPPPRRDPGGKRKWWFENEVKATLDGLQQQPKAAK